MWVMKTVTFPLKKIIPTLLLGQGECYIALPLVALGSLPADWVLVKVMGTTAKRSAVRSVCAGFPDTDVSPEVSALFRKREDAFWRLLDLCGVKQPHAE